MPKYMKIQKSSYYKDYSKCPKIQGPKEGKPILIFTKKVDPTLAHGLRNLP